MALRRILVLIDMRGFTVIETLIVFGLLVSAISFTTFVSSTSYQRALALHDAERIAGALRHARSLAQASICDRAACDEALPVRVHITSDAVSLFIGDGLYDSRPLSGASVNDDFTVTFLPGSGNVLRSMRIPIENAYGLKRLITVNQVGMVAVTPL